MPDHTVVRPIHGSENLFWVPGRENVLNLRPMTVQNSWLFVLLIPAAVLVGVFCDWDRLKAHLEDRGGRLLRMRWAPFGKGWWGEGSDRIYHVRYLDPDGNERHAFCKTSMGSGVYFPDDKTLGIPNPGKFRNPIFVPRTRGCGRK